MKRNTILIISAIAIPLASLAVAFAGVLTPVYIQHSNNETQIKMKQYEVTYLEKQKLYANFMKDITETYYNASASLVDPIYSRNQDKVIAEYYAMEPFLSSKTRPELWTLLMDYISFLDSIHEKKLKLENIVDTFISYRDSFRMMVFGQLFGSE